MTYINSSVAPEFKTKQFLWDRLHWERIALLALNFGLWAIVAGLFT